MASNGGTSVDDLTHYMQATSRLHRALSELEKPNGCFGICAGGDVPGVHLANHTRACRRARVALGEPIPDGWTWDGDDLISERTGMVA